MALSKVITRIDIWAEDHTVLATVDRTAGSPPPGTWEYRYDGRQMTGYPDPLAALHDLTVQMVADEIQGCSA